MLWQNFIYFALSALLLWIIGAVTAWKNKKAVALGVTALGLAIFLVYIIMMWTALERPPMRTMGETRLWYAFFLPLAGIIVYSRWHYRWILSFSTILATVFIGVNLFKPEIHTKAMMPALQSPWFAPHVIVYMFAYAMLGAATVMAIYMLIREFRAAPSMLPHHHQSPNPSGLPDSPDSTDSSDSADLPASTDSPNLPESPDLPASLHSSARPDSSTEFAILDNLVSVGWVFLTLGMLFGALWAKAAWGHYWSWDPKETWAAVTWMAYLVYIHLRLRPSEHRRATLWTLLVSFCLLQMCWWGINYLPSAQGTSVHTYNSN